MTNLLDIAEIRSGFYAKPEVQGSIYYLQARYLRPDGQLYPDVTPELNPTARIQKQLLEDGDVLLAARGDHNTALVYRSALIGPAVASGTYLVLRVRQPRQLLADFLCWHLNRESTQAQLGILARGSNIQALTKRILAGLQVPVPAVHVQELIVRIDQLYRREKELKLQIAQLQQKRLDLLFRKALQPLTRP